MCRRFTAVFRLLPARAAVVCALLPAALFITGCGGKKRAAVTGPPDLTPSFWIWHRSSPLTTAETASLQALAGPQGSPHLYRQLGEFGYRDGRWSARPFSKEPLSLDPSTTTPVVRLDPGFLERPDAAESLCGWLRSYYPAGVPGSLQLDYDCPVRLLPAYSRLLKRLRNELSLRTLSVTALPSWIEAPAFGQVADAVDEMIPMFYDLVADTPAKIVNHECVAMAGPEAAVWIPRWKACPCAWRAGLANFERLTLFGKDGSLVGHLRQWSLDDIASFHPALIGPEKQDTGRDDNPAAWFRIFRDGGLQGTALKQSQILLWRAPGDESLRRLCTSAFAAGARGIVWFALPGPGLRACHTPAHLAALERGEEPQPALTVSVDEHGSMILHNDGPGDLNGNASAGQAASTAWPVVHHLTLTAAQPGVFVERGPGEFLRVGNGPQEADRSRSAMVIPLGYATTIHLTFTSLPAGGTLTSDPGLITPSSTAQLRWSVDGGTATPVPEK